MEAELKEKSAAVSDTDELTIEESFERLDAILEKMEDEENCFILQRRTGTEFPLYSRNDICP